MIHPSMDSPAPSRIGLSPRTLELLSILFYTYYSLEQGIILLLG